MIRRYDHITIEDLNVCGMVRNHHLAKSISDAGWNQFVRILTSKAANAGREVILVNPAIRRKDCSQCGSRVRKSRAVRSPLHQLRFVAHRDRNAAINIQKRGQKRRHVLRDGLRSL
ncbi:MAG: transposase [Acidobacteria bacterium]|nr:transposase [Acidobacteriota bacterium]